MTDADRFDALHAQANRTHICARCGRDDDSFFALAHSLTVGDEWFCCSRCALLSGYRKLPSAMEQMNVQKLVLALQLLREALDEPELAAFLLRVTDDQANVDALAQAAGDMDEAISQDHPLEPEELVAGGRSAVVAVSEMGVRA